MNTVRTRRRGQRGQALIVLALVGIAVFGFGAVALDQGMAMADRRDLQATADDAALAGARSGLGTNTGNFVALQYLAKSLNFTIAGLSGQGCTSSSVCPAGTYTTGTYTIVLADNGTTSLDVTVKHQRQTMVAGVLGFRNEVTASSARAGTGASVAGGACVLCILNPTASGALSATGNGSVSVSGGSIVVNSSSTSAATLTGNGSISASGAIDIKGNYTKTGNGSYSPTPVTGFTAVSDPLSAVPVPSVSGTSNGAYSLTGNGSATINPGIYSSIGVTGNGSLTLNPGIYVITSGAMGLTGNGSITGNGVLLYFACSSYPTGCTSGQSGGNLQLTGNGSVSVSAPTAATCSSIPATCPYQGLLVFYDRNNAAGLSLTGNGSTGPTGTAYAKSAAVTLTGNGSTVNSLVIADTVTLTGNGSISVSYTASQNYQATSAGGLLR